MGFLDRMLKDGVGKALGNAVSDAVGDALNNALGVDVTAQAASAQTTCPSCGAPLRADAKFCAFCGAKLQQAAAPAAQAAAAQAPRDRAYFADILTTEFGGYELRQNVSPAELGGSGKPYDFVLCRGGRPVGAVMLTEHNRDRNAAFLNAKAACEQAGVPFINFYLHMPNERNYIVGRIKGMV